MVQKLASNERSEPICPLCRKLLVWTKGGYRHAEETECETSPQTEKPPAGDSAVHANTFWWDSVAGVV